MHKIILTILITLIFIGCDSPKKDPHVFDPIYQHMSKLLDESNKEKEILEGEISKLSSSIEKLELGSNAKGDLLDELFKKKRQYTKIKEQISFLKLKLKERKLQDSIEYLKAFNNKEPWPNPNELTQFKETLKLELKRGKEWRPEDRIKEFSNKKHSRSPSSPSGH